MGVATAPDRGDVELTPVARGEAPPPGPALDHPPTRAAMGRLRRVPLWGLLVAVVAAGVSAGLWALGAPDSVWLFPTSVVGAALVVAVHRAIRARWLGRLLRREPWVARWARHHLVGSGQYTWGVLVIAADEHGPEVMATVQESWVRSLSLVDGSIPVWVAGDPTRRAAATAGAQDLVVIAPVRTAWARRRFQAGIDLRESGTRPDLYHPQGRSLWDPEGRRRSGTARRRR